MTRPLGSGGFEPGTQPAERRALFDLRRKIEALEAGAIEATAWVDVTFQNSWVNYGSGYQDVQYRKLGDMVQVRGLMKSGTNAVAAFTLPTGFRPPAILLLPSVSLSYQVALTTVNTDGTVVPNTGSGSNGYYSCEFQFSVTA